jgi:hypothetical protein
LEISSFILVFISVADVVFEALNSECFALIVPKGIQVFAGCFVSCSKI